MEHKRLETSNYERYSDDFPYKYSLRVDFKTKTARKVFNQITTRLLRYKFKRTKELGLFFLNEALRLLGFEKVYQHIIERRKLELERLDS